MQHVRHAHVGPRCDLKPIIHFLLSSDNPRRLERAFNQIQHLFEQTRYKSTKLTAKGIKYHSWGNFHCVKILLDAQGYEN